MAVNIKFSPGTHIEQAAEQLVAAAVEHGTATGQFNDVPLTADASSTPAEIVSRWNSESDARAAAWRASPEGKKAEQESNQRRADAQTLHDSLMKRLPALNMKDDAAVLDWLCQMQGPTDHVGVIVRRDTIVSHFEKAGYRSNVNYGDDFKPRDRDNVFRYLVGQALHGLKEGPAIHPILHKFAAEWRADFRVVPCP